MYPMEQVSREKQNELDKEKQAHEFNEDVRKAARRRASWHPTTGNGDLDCAIKGYIEVGFHDGANWAKNRVKRQAYLEIAESLEAIVHPVYQRIAKNLMEKADALED
jgi:hypothetical protein